ncbi:hypothetical protein [Mesorhizobium sp.]|uniref:hypothetical protein n=1 Tax=Mesorhizobium sp. TaxID=1871066 RepID=UPI00121EC9FF|nr:hypothetical protein [Mesorhizobium sp.]TIX28872.1 MAG: hypothetical protein E5V35_00490 [Mesorhizobium sp.]
MSYALIAFLFINGHVNAYVIDHGLTYEDCGAAIAAALPSDIPIDLAAALANAPRVCELESGK